MAVLRGGFLLLPAAQAFLGAQDEVVEDGAGGFGVGGEPVVEMVAHGALDQAGGLGGGEAVLGLADEFGLADEAGDQRAAAPVRSSRVICAALRLPASSP